jgi:hypothetical protein
MRILVCCGAMLVLLLAASTTSAQPSADQRPESRTQADESSRSARDVAGRDSVINVAAAVPPPGTLRTKLNAGADRVQTTGELGSTFGAGLIWSIGSGIATEVEATSHGASAYPQVALRWQWLRQSRAGIDATASARYGSFGSELPAVSGGSIGGQLALGRQLGRLHMSANGIIARGIIDRTDVDAIAGAAMLVDVLPGEWRVGLDSRLRTEVEDTYKTVEDLGRPLELTGGVLSAHRYGPTYLQVLLGWQAPRGLAPPGPVVLASGSIDF